MLQIIEVYCERAKGASRWSWAFAALAAFYVVLGALFEVSIAYWAALLMLVLVVAADIYAEVAMSRARKLMLDVLEEAGMDISNAPKP